jgi:PKD repeat protein
MLPVSFIAIGSENADFSYIDNSTEILEGSRSPDSTRESTTAKWTIMVYMAADNNLEYYGVQDLNELERIGSNEDINIVVQLDRNPESNINSGYTNSNGDWKDTRRFLVQHDEDTTEFYNYTENKDMWLIGEQNMADPDTFGDFLHWAVGNYSAEHYLLVLWDHGEGIFSDGRGSSQNSGDSGSSDIIKTQTRGICNDETDGGWLDLWEMGEVFSDIKKEYNTIFDIIAFDICWIGTFETAYELVPYADYFAASPEEEPNPGWNYGRPISYLAENPDISPADLAVRITTDFKEEYKEERYLEWKYLTYLAMDLRRFESKMIPLLNAFADTMGDSIYDNYNQIDNARSNTMYPHRKGYMRDLFHFAQLIEDDKTVTDEVRWAAAAINDEYNKTILKYVHGSKQPKGMGPTLYFPERDYRGEYDSKISFVSEQWDEFLELFLTPIQISHTPLNDTEGATGKVKVSAIIKGFNLDEENIYVFYQDDKDDFRMPFQMTKSQSGVEHEFTTTMSLQNTDTMVYYHIRTQESGMNAEFVQSPRDMSDNDVSTWYSFYVGKDSEPPMIAHEPSFDIIGSLGEPYTFYVNITDNLGLDPASLYFNYNLDNSDNFIHKSLELDTYPERYRYTLSKQPKDTIIYYYLTASDQAEENNSARAPTKGVFEFNVSRVKPVADFNANKLQSYTYEPIIFTSTSKPEETISTYTWDFGDGTAPVKTQDNSITHEFIESNSYTVILTVTDENGLWDSKSLRISIMNSPPQVSIETNPILVNDREFFLDDQLYIDGTIYEDDEIVIDCSGSDDPDGYIQTWTWQFGDGNKYTELCTDWNGDGRFDIADDKVIVQTEMSPSEQRERLNSTQDGKLIYKFPNAGDYRIRFSGIDNDGEVSEVQYFNVFVENKKPVADPGYLKIDGYNVEFTPARSGINSIDTPSDLQSLNYTWDFGDDRVSYLPYPNHTYSKEDTYQVTLTVRDDDGSESTASFELKLKEGQNGEMGTGLMLLIISIIIVIVVILIIVIVVQNRSTQDIKSAEIVKGPAELRKDEQRLAIGQHGPTVQRRSTRIGTRTMEPPRPVNSRSAGPPSRIQPVGLGSRKPMRSSSIRNDNSEDIRVKELMSVIKGRR